MPGVDETSLADMSFVSCNSASPVKVVKAKRKSVNLKRRKSIRKSLYLAPTSSTTNKLTVKAVPVRQEMMSTLGSSSSLMSKLCNQSSSNLAASTMSTFTLKPSQKKLTIPVAPISHVAKRRESKFGSSLKSKSLDETKLNHGKGKGVNPTKTIVNRGLTIPVPFNMGVSKRAKDTSSINEGRTAAEIAQRFLRNPRSTGNSSTTHNKLTVPKSPIFKTTERAKTSFKDKPLSHVEKEEMEMEELSKHQFRARTMDKRIFNSMGEMGVPKVASKKSTVPLDTHFASDRRASVRASLMPTPAPKEDIVETPFKARPMPIYRAPSFSSRDEGDNARGAQLTIPDSPKFAERNNGRRASSAPARRQMPHHSVLEEKRQKAKGPKPQRKGLTDAKEFTLQTNSRSSLYHSQFEEQMQREMEQEQLARKVKALPLPSHRDKPFAFRAPIHKELTEAHPFNLHSEGRHSMAQASFQQGLEKEQAALEKATTFQAKHTPQSTYQPTVIQPAPHKRLIPQEVSLQSDQRSSKRKEYDQSIAKKMSDLQSLQESMHLQTQEKENQDIQALRRKPVSEGGMAFKAAPVQKEDLYPAPPTKAMLLTEPKSPCLQSKNRSRQSIVPDRQDAKRASIMTKALSSM
jgi:hypothetical protein